MSETRGGPLNAVRILNRVERDKHKLAIVDTTSVVVQFDPSPVRGSPPRVYLYSESLGSRFFIEDGEPPYFIGENHEEIILQDALKIAKVCSAVLREFVEALEDVNLTLDSNGATE